MSAPSSSIPTSTPVVTHGFPDTASRSPSFVFASALLSAVMSVLSKVIGDGPWTWSGVFKLLIFIGCLINIKSFPLTWHVRFYRSLISHMYIHKSIYPAPSHLFSPRLTLSRSPPYECDLNGHKSNSTYFSDLDIARTHLMAHLTKKSFQVRKQRGDKLMYVALAGVACMWRREIKPGVRYAIRTRVLGWEGKWVFVVSHFTTPDWRPAEGKEGEEGYKPAKGKLYATALSKYVFKSGRQTVPPETVFRESGLIPERPEGSAPTPRDRSPDGTGANTPDGLNEDITAESQVERLVRETKEVARKEKGKRDGEDYWTWERIEAERKRGLEVAKAFLELDPLDGEIRNGGEEGLARVPAEFTGF